MWFWLKSTLKDIKIRIEYWFELSSWEKLKRKEGFPEEWFEDGPTEEEVAQVDEIQADLKDELYKEK